MDVTQLRTLIHVAELGSLSRAAERLRIAQPALSRQVRLLEAELGVRLFDRHGRGMVPTEAGLRVLEQAARVLGELDAVRAVATDDGGSLRGRVTVGTPPTLATVLASPLARRTRERHPALALRFASAFSGHLLDWVQRGEIDLAVSYDPQPLRSLRIEPLMTEELVLVGPPGALSLDRPLPFRALAERPLVLPGMPHGLRAVIDACAHEARIALRTGLEADSLQIMVDLVRSGFGETILPLAPVRAEVEAGRLSAARLVEPIPTRALVLVRSAHRPATPASRFVASAIEEIIAEVVSQASPGAAY